MTDCHNDDGKCKRPRGDCERACAMRIQPVAARSVPAVGAPEPCPHCDDTMTADEKARHECCARCHFFGFRLPAPAAAGAAPQAMPAEWTALPYDTPRDLYRAFKAGARFVLHYHGKQYPVARMEPRTHVVYVQPPNMPVKVFPNGKSAEGDGGGIFLAAATQPAGETQAARQREYQWSPTIQGRVLSLYGSDADTALAKAEFARLRAAADEREPEDELNCAEEVLDALAAQLPMTETAFDCIGDYITAVAQAIRAPASEWLAWVADDGYRTDEERRAARALIPCALARPAAGAGGYEVRIAGPDDIVPFDDEMTAHRHANAVNQTYLADRLRHPDDEVLCVATVYPLSTRTAQGGQE